MEHDNAYKLLFSRSELVADLLRDFVRQPWVEALDLTTLDRVSALRDPLILSRSGHKEN